MRNLTKDQNARIKEARKEFLAARHKYKKMVHAIRSEKRMANLSAQGKIPSTMIPTSLTFWERTKKGMENVLRYLSSMCKASGSSS